MVNIYGSKNCSTISYKSGLNLHTGCMIKIRLNHSDKLGEMNTERPKQLEKDLWLCSAADKLRANTDLKFTSHRVYS